MRVYRLLCCDAGAEVTSHSCGIWPPRGGREAHGLKTGRLCLQTLYIFQAFISFYNLKKTYTWLLYNNCRARSGIRNEFGVLMTGNF